MTTRKLVVGGFSMLVDADPGHPGAVVPAGLAAGVASLNAKTFGARGDNAADDYPAIAAAVAACPAGGDVYLPPGQYKLSQTLVLPANVTLRGAFGYRYQQYTGTPTYLKPYFGNFTGTALIQCADEADGWQLLNLALVGVGALNTQGGAIHGLASTGYVKGVKLRDLLAYNFSGDGVHTDTSATGQPGGWECRGLYLSGNSGYGWRSADSAGKGIAFTDSKVVQSEAGANGLDGWRLDGAPTNDFVGVWATWNGGHGFYLNTKVSNLQFTACQTDRNGKNGWYLQASEQVLTNPSPRVVTLTGCLANRDGRNGNAGQAGYAGLRVEGTSTGTPHAGVVLNGFSTHVGVDDDGSGQRSPDYGVFATNASTVLLSDGFVQGTVKSLADDNNAVRDAGSVVHSLCDFNAGTVTTLGPVGGEPAARPSDLGYYSWAYDPVTATGSGTPTAGVLYLQRCPVRSPRSLSKVVYVFPSVTGLALTAGQCFVAVYGPDGTRLAVSGDISGLVVAQEVAFSLLSAAAAPVPFVWAAVLLNGTTMPTMARGPALGGQGQSQLAASAARFATYGTAQTATPAALTLGSIAKGTAYCAAVL